MPCRKIRKSVLKLQLGKKDEDSIFTIFYNYAGTCFFF